MENPIEIINWTPFATWTHKTSTDACSICREDLIKPCAQCIATCEEDINCPVSKANCGHCFHKHCINKWLGTANNCPTCSLPIHISIENLDSQSIFLVD